MSLKIRKVVGGIDSYMDIKCVNIDGQKVVIEVANLEHEADGDGVGIISLTRDETENIINQLKKSIE